ncbi:uncharacterized protein LOC125663257 [Ostrea edulis]|uniref:uncharacterized protein LOC125663257 n=1 Tax=Ostrea edulis TaxID=37623 RepID=UPI0024AEDA25|nr:uncharacterized protein LOC125663257 [Ostrea edulis]
MTRSDKSMYRKRDMGSVTYLCFVLAGLLCIVQAQTFQIRRKFINGNLKLKWANISTNPNDITVTKDGLESKWTRIYDDKYTVEDVWLYKSVNIRIREYTGSSDYSDYNLNYSVSRIDSQEGETKILRWMAVFFPRNGKYTIYHFCDDTSRAVIWLRGGSVITIDPVKYVYQTRPHNSTNIKLEVKNITLMDAGYYGGGTSQNAARRGQGGILVVRGKPTKPEIAGILEVNETSDVILTCSSYSTSRPKYYRKTVSLKYVWFINNTVIASETNKTLRFPRISKDVRFNKYSCLSNESIVSENSEEIKINVLYGPSSIIISPQLPVNKTVSVKDGDFVGPYNCSADCNPACTIQWVYKLSSGTFGVAKSDGRTLLQQRVLKDKDSFQCVAKSTFDKLYTSIDLYIMYLSEASFNANGKMQESVDISEGEQLILSCVVDGRPTPRLSISRYSQIKILKSKVSNVIHVSIPEVKCSNTDMYRCTGSSAGFVSKQKEVAINVHCKTRIDAKSWFKANYGIKSGIGVKVVVNAPIISYPKPSANMISWSGPTSTNIQNEIKERDVIYKHWITSTIPVDNERYFGNYTMAYNGEVIFTITINLEGKPKRPLNFTGYSYTSGYINLTWISNFNGGPEQFFILSLNDGAVWVEVANITDSGEGDVGYYDPGLLNPGPEHWYRLESCNRIGCSVRAVEVKVAVLDCKSGYYLDVKNPELHYRNNSDCLPCGNCRDNVPCNKTTGHCSEGCETTYKPPYCTELITSDHSSTIPTTTIVIGILSTLLVVATGVVLQQRMRKQQQNQLPQPNNDHNPITSVNRQRLQTEDGYQLPFHEYINAASDEHAYDKIDPPNEGPYHEIQDFTNTHPVLCN